MNGCATTIFVKSQSIRWEYPTYYIVELKRTKLREIFLCAIDNRFAECWNRIDKKQRRNALRSVSLFRKCVDKKKLEDNLDACWRDGTQVKLSFEFNWIGHNGWTRALREFSMQTSQQAAKIKEPTHSVHRKKGIIRKNCCDFMCYNFDNN